MTVEPLKSLGLKQNSIKFLSYSLYSSRQVFEGNIMISNWSDLIMDIFEAQAYSEAHTGI